MTGQRLVRVFVADDHPLLRDGLARRINERIDMELIGEADDGLSALNAIRELRPDVAVLDIKMPGLDGIRVAAAVAQGGLDTGLVILTAFQDPALAYKSLRAG